MEHQIQIESFWTDKTSSELRNDFISLANNEIDCHNKEQFVENEFGRLVFLNQ